MSSKLPPIFNPSDSIVSLFSGLNATEDVQRDLLKAEFIGKTKAQEFIDNLMKQNNVGFYDTIKKKKLKTFLSLNVAQTLSVEGNEVIIRADRSLFGRLLTIREKRGISMKEVLQYSLGPIAPHGSIFKSVKSKLNQVGRKHKPTR